MVYFTNFIDSYNITDDYFPSFIFFGTQRAYMWVKMFPIGQRTEGIE